MKYAPGSFSKNFAWHGTGLRKLHGAIRSGFNGRLKTVGRDDWRADSGIGDASLELIPINFFMHNRAGEMSVDELVFRAVRKPHGLGFDRLALFALHLNRAGSGQRVISRPTMWANEYVRNILWKDDTWSASALDEAAMDAFIATRMRAGSEVRIKCRSNYRHLFELCDYLPASLSMINSGFDQWLPSAFFLAWDRHILDGGQAAKRDLVDVVKRDELHKLVGASEEYIKAQASVIADIYVNAGNLGRFALPTLPPRSAAPAPPVQQQGQRELPEEGTSEWIDQDESDAAVERRTVETQAQVRSRKKAAALKKRYENTCTFCGARLQIAPDQHYSEAAHVRALGKPHNGPDRVANMIVLCPNHHLQFDRGVLRLKKTSTGFVIQSRVRGDSLHGKPILLRHDLDPDMVKYHSDWHAKSWR